MPRLADQRVDDIRGGGVSYGSDRVGTEPRPETRACEGCRGNHKYNRRDSDAHNLAPVLDKPQPKHSKEPEGADEEVEIGRSDAQRGGRDQATSSVCCMKCGQHKAIGDDLGLEAVE